MTQAMIEKIQKEEIEYLSFPQLTEYGVFNAFSLKNLNFRNQEGMQEVYQEFLGKLEWNEKSIVKPRQEHTDKVVSWNPIENQEKYFFHPEELMGVDGIITSQNRVILATTSADCLCMVLFDYQKKILANVHSGWRGTFQKVAQKAVQKMKEDWECERGFPLYPSCITSNDSKS